MPEVVNLDPARIGASGQAGRAARPGHLVPPWQARRLEDRRRHVARMPSPSDRPASDRPIATSGTGFSEWAVTGLPSRSRSSSALPWSAVIKGPRRPGRVRRLDPLDRLDDTPQAGVDRLERSEGRIPHARMANHVGVGVVGDDEVVLGGRDRSDQLVGDARGAHLGLEVVRGDLWRRHQAAILAGPRSLAAAVEEVRHMGVLLGLGHVELAPAASEKAPARDRASSGANRTSTGDRTRTRSW